MKIIKTSPFTGNISEMELDITAEQITAYNNGALLQNAFPNLNAGEREFYKTGITPAEWDSMFGTGE